MRITFILLLLFSLSSCVSKKKHLEQITLLQTNFAKENKGLSQELESARGEINRLELSLAERKGENNALTAMQDKLQGRIDQLEAEIENTSSNALSTKETLNQNIQNKDREITQLRQLLVEVNLLLDSWETQMAEITQVLQDSLQSFDNQLWSVATNNGNAVVILQENLLFRSNSVSRLESDGTEALEKISEIIQRYPKTQMSIIAHTDNTAPRNRSYQDNWNYSTLRAATIARLMTEEFYVSANQITAAGKGEFAPVASNETEEGREQNRRIELVISPRAENMVREIRRKLASF
jgi:chemotaxis protein MotB